MSTMKQIKAAIAQADAEYLADANQSAPMFFETPGQVPTNNFMDRLGITYTEKQFMSLQEMGLVIYEPELASETWFTSGAHKYLCSHSDADIAA